MHLATQDNTFEAFLDYIKNFENQNSRILLIDNLKVEFQNKSIMAEIIRMPRMSDTMEEGVIVGWLKNVGDEVEPGDVLAEVETDKATMELESFHEGVLLHIGVKEGPVQVNGILAVIGEKGEDFQAELDSAQNDSGNSSPADTKPAENGATENATEVVHEQMAVAETVSDTRVKASPLAKQMAKSAGINLASIAGSGDNGRIVKKDIEARLNQNGSGQSPAAPSAPAMPSTPQYVPSTSSEASFEDVPMSMMRKAIAKNVVANKFTVPHFYLTIEMDMENAIIARGKMNEIAAPTKISYNDLVLKAAAVALRKHPIINASFLDGNSIRYNNQVNIGVAVATPDGLLLPVIRNTDTKSLSQINGEVRALAGLAKEKKLPPEEMQGSTFMISNLGMFGIEEFTAIVNRPNACSMAVGSIIDKAVVKDGAVVPGKRMKVTLSCDHRVVDGATGAEFLKTFRAVMEDPIRMLV